MSASRSHSVFTIGHSAHDPAVFVRLLSDQGVSVLADVRSRPYSRHAPQFNKPRLEATLKAAGIDYVYLGKELGGIRSEPELRDANGRTDGVRTAASPVFLDGIHRLERLASERCAALMCAEEDPLRCHRFHLISPVLLARGLTVRHIRGDGRVEPDEMLRTAQKGPRPDGQGALF